MLPSASVAAEFLGVKNASEAIGTVVNSSRNLESIPGKHLPTLRFMQDMSRIKQQMVQNVLSSIRLSDKNADFGHVNRQGEGFNGRDEASSQREMLELFPISTGSCLGSNPRATENKITSPFTIGQTYPDSSRSVSANSRAEQSTAQLTIFYNGAMNVYNVPPEKAQAIMKLASANSFSNTRTSTITSSKIEQLSKSLPSQPLSNAVNENQPQPQRLPAGLGAVRKLSLQRFLQKRKERFNSVAPYTTMKPARLQSKAENETDGQIILSLASSRLKF